MLGWCGFGRRGSWNRSTGDKARLRGGRRRWRGDRRRWGRQSSARGSRTPAVGAEAGSLIELFVIGGACSAGGNSIDLLLLLLLAHGRSVSGSRGIVRYRLLVLLELVLSLFWSVSTLCRIGFHLAASRRSGGLILALAFHRIGERRLRGWRSGGRLTVLRDFHWRRLRDRERFPFLKGNPGDEGRRNGTCGHEPEPTQRVNRAWTRSRDGRSGFGGGNALLGDQDIFLGVQTNGNVERRCEMRKDNLATVAAQDVIFPESAFFERERTIVIGGQRFGIGAHSGE